MNRRERTLSIATGALVVFAVAYWSIGKYRTAIDDRAKTLEAEQTRLAQMEEMRAMGEYAANQMGDYIAAALPGDVESSSRKYAGWLLELTRENRFQSVVVDPIQVTRQGELYDQLSFRVEGRAQMANWIDFLHQFYDRQQLHRIRTWSLRPSKQGDLQLDATIDVLAMADRPNDLPPLTSSSRRVDADVNAYQQPILDRNFFNPPNQSPKFRGNETLVATVGRQQDFPLDFDDPEGNAIRYELIESSDPLPDDVEVTVQPNGSIRVKGDVKQTFRVRVRATDDGYPQQSIEQSIAVSIDDPPPPPPPQIPPAKYDEAKQTVMTASVRGRPRAAIDDAGKKNRDGWEIWLRVRTRDETMKLHVGDEFEVGSIKAMVDWIGPASAKLRIGEQTYEIKPNQTLLDAIGGDFGTTTDS